MGLFDRDTDMSDDADDDGDDGDGPQFEPIAGTADRDDAVSGDGDDAGGDEDPLSKLVGARFRDDDFSGTLKRAVDVEAGVVLYAYSNGNAGGVTAVPIDQTRLLDGA
ncbi:hypothetical protein Hbl1158_14545 [Halobaculum sp. CBA1158]|uniref:hypothetical protein n=1 Tax=Halobaculum sp. CBA1158 TaxID=2904243 RepID=UPI001F1AB885|nr:hypothetical protein [Halobaculum sp. CBA1158]UIO99723.1 hypothetical protein Hbl1158_14545 [Halobaculum sp. CBA1158]